MFYSYRKKKIQDEGPTIGNRVAELIADVACLRQQVKQLECDHSFQFTEASQCMFLPGIGRYVRMKCTDCKKHKSTRWDELSFAERRAYRNLKLVPNDWPMHIKKEDK